MGLCVWLDVIMPSKPRITSRSKSPLHHDHPPTVQPPPHRRTVLLVVTSAAEDEPGDRSSTRNPDTRAMIARC